MRTQRIYQHGFTLIEILVVISVISVFMALVVPQLGQGNRSKIRQEAIYFTNVVKWISEQSLYTQQQHRLVIDFQNQQYSAQIKNPSYKPESDEYLDEKENKEYLNVKNKKLSRHKLDREIVRMQTLLEFPEPTIEQQIHIKFNAWGPEMPLAIYFSEITEEDDEQGGYTVKYKAMARQPIMMQGKPEYIE